MNKQNIMLKSVKQNLAYGLRLKPSNKIVGIALLFDITSLKQVQDKAPKDYEQDARKCQDAYKTYNQIQDKMLNLQKFNKNQVVFIMYLAIDPQFVNYQQGHLLYALTFRKIFDSGYRKIYGIIYNPASLKIFINLSGKIVSKLKDQEENIQFFLVSLQCTQNQNLHKYIETNKLKTLKQMKKKPSSQIPKSKL